MKLFIVIVGSVIAAALLLVGLIVLIGSTLPRSHVASRSVLLHQSRQQIYTVIRDFGSAPTWRGDIQGIEIINSPGEKLHFREQGKHGNVTYELAEDVPNERIVTRIVDTDLGYSGKWTYAFAEEDGGTRVSITEDGDVSNVVFRFMSRYIFGHTATIEAYLTALAKRFRETATPQ